MANVARRRIAWRDLLGNEPNACVGIGNNAIEFCNITLTNRKIPENVLQSVILCATVPVNVNKRVRTDCTHSSAWHSTMLARSHYTSGVEK